ncbi:MAG TPA: YHS domain-containing (seleno)protein [Burkholderiales bacterium]|nr:YHS domain-containing (seleno)protein [Burkholderiales bacterium]HEU4922446.1 YHS domain-containing (seleno)protein [Burkholderiales bacterium]
MKKLMLALAAVCFSTALVAQSPSVSLKGHDPVAYFTEGRPVKGSTGINYDFDDARYLFSSQKNRELFASSPDRYTPQYSGLCATGMALGAKAQADPTVWKIVDGKLYVFSSTQAREKFESDPAMLAKAQQNWQQRK